MSLNDAIRRELRSLLSEHFQASFPDFESSEQLDRHTEAVLALLQPLPDHIAKQWPKVFGLIVCRNRSKSDIALVQNFWLAMNQLTGLSKAELQPESAPWIDAAVTKPPVALAPNGQRCNSGWSKWVLCCNTDLTIDDVGAALFVAAYSWELERWHRIGNDRTVVTHWRDDIVAPPPTTPVIVTGRVDMSPPPP